MVADRQIEAPIREINMQRMAWIILVAAFILFCSSTMAFTAGVYYYFFRSSVPLETVLQVGRGTAVIVAPDSSQRGERDTAILNDRSSTVSTDTQSQATISYLLFDDAEEESNFATLTLKNSTTVKLLEASRPRFNWSDGYYFIDLDIIAGELDVVVTAIDIPLFRIQIHTPIGAIILLNQPGRYSLAVDETQANLIVREGEAALLPPNSDVNRLISRDQEALIIASHAPIVVPALLNLLENSIFTFAVSPEMVAEENLPVRWECSDAPDALPHGRFISDTWKGRVAMRMLRSDEAASHGETGCRQPLTRLAGDVTDFDYLDLQTTFLINYQSLSECGTQGSECPLMLHMTYTDVNNVDREWHQGFYYNSNPQSDWPRRCDSCDEAHRQINKQVWYSYETGNLFTLFPAEQRPAVINEVEVYASGHQYDVFISEIVLLAGNQEAEIPSQYLIPTSDQS